MGAKHRVKRPGIALVLVAFAVAAAAVAPGRARAQGVFTLTSEIINGPLTSISYSCHPDGVSSATMTASGIATGPYPGTFTASVTATFGPFSISPEGVVSGGQVLSWQEYFTIDSVLGQITGTKTLPSPPGNTLGFCDFPGGALVQVLADNLAYEAHLQDQTDRGTAGAGFSYLGVFGTSSVFGEIFTSIPTTTPGKATGGGQLGKVDASTKDAATTFAFTAYSDPKLGIHARCNVQNNDVKILCRDATAYQQVGNSAEVTGPAIVNNTETWYQINVQDNADPGAGADTFSILTGIGYSVGGVLTQGNIQVQQ
jgi:hypothetical protein